MYLKESNINMHRREMKYLIEIFAHFI